jgi:DNA-binding GntR family transcriptional regulator
LTKQLTNQEIYERVYSAISERRLAPGTKLSEERLAQTFQVSRPRIREVLSRLSQELLVELRLNRGAYVASPTSRDLRDIFEMRRALERAIAAQISAAPDAQALAVLRRHLESEERARQTGDRAMLARLTGEFHVRLAEITDNRMFADSLRRLVTLTSLVISQNDALASSACPQHEHSDIVAAIEAGDARRCERLMTEHLHHVEQGIELPSGSAPELDFKQIFALAPPAPKVREPRAARHVSDSRKPAA